MKRCGRCKLTKPVEDFHKNKRRPDGLQSQCRACKVDLNSAYYKNTPERNAQRQEWKARNIPLLKKYVLDFLLENPCVDCGESDPVVLDFDHLRDKEFTISKAMQGGMKLDRVVAEIEKCEVRCANCHRRVTAQRAGWWKLTVQ